jgi:hypothetical protein
MNYKLIEIELDGKKLKVREGSELHEKSLKKPAPKAKAPAPLHKKSDK